jgi:hypothetical protein
MMKGGQDPTLPAPLSFIGHPNGTEVAFHFNPTFRAFNGTKIVSGECLLIFL